MEPDLLRDAVIVGILGLILLAARVPLRTTALILVLAVVATVLLDALVTELIETG